MGPDDDARGRRGALAAEDLRASDSLERHRQRFACAGHRDRYLGPADVARWVEEGVSPHHSGCGARSETLIRAAPSSSRQS